MRKIEQGEWAQVIGTFDLASRSGAILSMQPTKVAFASLPGGDDRVRLKGFDGDDRELFDLSVNPLTASCGTPGESRMFEEFVPMTRRLRDVRLYVDGVKAATYAPGSPQPSAPAALGQPGPQRLHRFPINSSTIVEPNVSFILQVRPAGDPRWHTMAAGIEKPDDAAVDINQFPGATSLDIRILRTNGLETSTVLETTKTF